MSVDQVEKPPPATQDVVKLPRRSIDKILVGFGAITAVVFVIAGGLLTWGANFSNDYVRDELSSQNVFFPKRAELESEGRTDLLDHAGQQVTTGDQAEAYASYIGGHLEAIADGQTYSEIDDRGAAAAVVDAKESGASATEVAALQATSDQLSAQRDSLFKGETLRGLLLSSYAWSTIGGIAAIAAWVAFAAAMLMAALTAAGVVHLRRTHDRPQHGTRSPDLGPAIVASGVSRECPASPERSRPDPTAVRRATR